MMVFEDEDRDEEEEQDDDNDNDNDNNNHNEPEPEPEPETMILLTPPTFHTHHHHNNNNNKLSAVVVPRYRECLKNHAVNIGGHALDGCGEFMPAGPDGTIDALKCAACNCHRNFHRKEHVTAADNHRQLTLYHPPPPHVYQFYRPAAVPAVSPTTPTTPGFLAAAGGRQLVLPAGETAEEQVTGGMMAMTMTTTTNTTTSSSGKKRHRTKFSQEQKDKMLALAEKLGWKIQKCDESVIQEFCDESGVKRHVLKVWMHNNKHTLGKKPPC